MARAGRRAHRANSTGKALGGFDAIRAAIRLAGGLKSVEDRRKAEAEERRRGRRGARPRRMSRVNIAEAAEPTSDDESDDDFDDDAYAYDDPEYSAQDGPGSSVPPPLDRRVFTRPPTVTALLWSEQDLVLYAGT
jgi:hypothetical protein